jgi:tetratricopeptide (TPR) repeat protein
MFLPKKFWYWSAGIFLVSVVLLLALPGIRSLDQFRRGRAAYNDGQYAAAASYFKAALESNPDSLEARRHLADAYLSQYVPGAESPENLRLAQAAQDEFGAVLKRTPNDEHILLAEASLYLKQQKLEEAARLYGRASELNPSNPEPFYALGLIAWRRFAPASWSARAALGSMPEDAGMIRDLQVRIQLRAEWLPVIDDGLRNLRKAVQIDREHDEAMSCISQLIRGRAEIAGNSSEYGDGIRDAAAWASRAEETRKRKAEGR